MNSLILIIGSVNKGSNAVKKKQVDGIGHIHGQSP